MESTVQYSTAYHFLTGKKNATAKVASEKDIQIKTLVTFRR